MSANGLPLLGWLDSLEDVTTEIMEKSNLAGYICPSCRMMFSALRNHSGHGVACPGCECLLRIPALEEKVKKLTVSEQPLDTASEKLREAGAMQFKNSAREDQFYDREEGEPGSEDKLIDVYPESATSLKLVIPIVVILLGLLGGIGYLFMGFNKMDNTIATNGQANLQEIGTGAFFVGDGESLTDEDLEVGFQYDPDNEVHVSRLEAFLKSWYEADSIDKMLKLVRPVDGLKEKMIRHYGLKPAEFSEFRVLRLVQNSEGEKGYIIYMCVTRNYKKSYGMLQFNEDSILMDWESYVAYSEMSWGELIENNPEDPVMVRVNAKRANYYNGAFSDDEKWQSVQLMNPNESDLLYGYVLRMSGDATLLFDFGNSDNSAFVLKVKSPSGAKDSNQLLIDEVVKKGWFIE